MYSLAETKYPSGRGELSSEQLGWPFGHQSSCRLTRATAVVLDGKDCAPVAQRTGFMADVIIFPPFLFPYAFTMNS